jgi:putative resolvase
MDRLLAISEAAGLLGVSESTLRRWEKEGRLVADERTEGNQRRYRLSTIRPDFARVDAKRKKTLGYIRGSSQDQKKDLERQREVLELLCTSNGWPYEIISDLGSGMNYSKKGLKKLIQEILSGHVGRVVVTHKDRLLRFGAELVFSICEVKGVEVLILNQGEAATFEEDLAKDVLEIITVFSARLYGSRSHKNKKMIEKLKKTVTAR